MAISLPWIFHPFHPYIFSCPRYSPDKPVACSHTPFSTMNTLVAPVSWTKSSMGVNCS